MTYIENPNHEPSMIHFDMQRNDMPIIKVIGVGGGGGNAVNHMFNQGIQGVDFVICNTDSQSLNLSPIPVKVQLGSSLTEGRGAGSLPSVGRNAALENIEDIRKILSDNTRMLFVTAGMGGGTGTGAAPVIAAVAREMNILTVGIVTLPFNFEGSKRRKQAEEGIKELREHVDSLLVINNDKLRELYGDLPLSKAFSKADNILTTAAKGIAEIITVTGYINVDFEDVKTVMKDSGVAIMGSGMAEGEDRAILAVEEALTSPLLNDNNIDGSGNILLYISSAQQEVTMDEVTTITDFIQAKAGQNAEIIWGTGIDESLGAKICVTLVATGFEVNGNENKNAKSREPNTILVGAIGDTPFQADQPLRKIEYTPPVIEPLNQAHVPDLPEEAPVIKLPEAEAEPWQMTVNASPLPEPEPEPEPEAEATPQAQPQVSVFNLYETPTDTGIIAQPEAEGFEEEAEAELETQPEPEPQTLAQENPVTEFRLHTAPTPAPASPSPPPMDREKTSNDRIAKLKELSLRLKTPDGIDQLEREPAFRRNKIEFQEPKHSSESELSQFTISTDDKGGIELKQNNSYLHGRPD